MEWNGETNLACEELGGERGDQTLEGERGRNTWDPSPILGLAATHEREQQMPPLPSPSYPDIPTDGNNTKKIQKHSSAIRRDCSSLSNNKLSLACPSTAMYVNVVAVLGPFTVLQGMLHGEAHYNHLRLRALLP